MAVAARIAVVVSLWLALPSAAAACPYCQERAQVWAGVFNENFVLTLLQVTSAVPLLILIALAFLWGDRVPFLAMAQSQQFAPLRRGPLLAAGIMLGIGLGGFLDGIFLHMLLQWHNLIAERIPAVDFVSLEINMFWDGIFNLGMWLIVAVGIGLLWRASCQPDVQWSGRTLIGTLLAGWGIFNVADSILFHWIFQLHHVKQGSPYWLWWDLGFLALGLVLIGLGWLLVWSARGEIADRGSARQNEPAPALRGDGLG